ncbi:hypothetical protein SHIRM173S_12452 [Streptomyces hirsutus]
MVSGAPAPFDQEEGRVVAGAAAPLLLQSVGECAHNRAYSLLRVFDAVDPVDQLLLAELLFTSIICAVTKWSGPNCSAMARSMKV